MFFISKCGRRDLNFSYPDEYLYKYIFIIPNIRLTMCGYFGTVLTLLYDQEVVDELVDYLIGAFELPDDVKIFCLQQFLPTMRNATEHIELPSDEFFKLEGNLLSTGLKLIYAFLWQVKWYYWL